MPSPFRPKAIRSRVLAAGTEWRNVTDVDHALDIFNSSGRGHARFSPLADDAGVPVPYLYVARQPVAAMLETVFHNVWGVAARRVGHSEIKRRVLRTIRFDTDVRVVDLHDSELARHGIGRHQLVSTSAEHYDCTQQWGAALCGASIGGQKTHGMAWQSRMVELAQSASSPLMQTMFVGDQTDVAVLYRVAGHPRETEFEVLEVEPLDSGSGRALVLELADLIGAVIDPA